MDLNMFKLTCAVHLLTDSSFHCLR